MALPFVVGVIISEVGRVIMEHFEDFVVVELDGRLGLHQVKTRQNGGKWTLTQLTTSATYGQPLLTMFTKFSLVRDLPTTHVLHVQGSLDEGSRAVADACLAHHVDEVASDIAQRLGSNLDETKQFLLRLAIKTDVADPEVIDAAMMARLLYPYTAKRLSAEETHRLYDTLLDRVCRAMEGNPPADPDAWLRALLESRPMPAAVLQKTLGPDELSGFVSYFQKERGQLLDAVGGEDDATQLVEKFRRGAAPRGLLDHVKLLRANAYVRHVEYLTEATEHEKDLADVQARIMTRVHQVLGEVESRPAPAGRVFSRLAELAQTRPELIDQRGVFGADPDLLLGVAMQLCDECRWSLD